MDIKTIDKENAQIIMQRYLNIPLTGFYRIMMRTRNEFPWPSVEPWPKLALETFRRHFDLFETFDFLDFLSFLSDSNPSLSSSLSDILIGYRLSGIILFLFGIETANFFRFWISSRSNNLFISRLWLISPTSKML